MSKQGRDQASGCSTHPSQPAKAPCRRELLLAGAAAGAALAAGAACGSNAASEQPAVDAGTSPMPHEQIPLGQVTLVRAETAEQAVARAVALTGALTFIKAGQKVVLKPNYTGPLIPPDTTSPNVLAELVRQCLRAGAGQVIVAERAFTGSNTAFFFDRMIYDKYTKSLRDHVEGAGGTLLALDNEPWVEVAAPDGSNFDQPIRIPKLLGEVDHFINVPALKTHNEAVLTMSMKNLFGYVHPDTRNQQVHKHPANKDDPDRPKRMFAQMNLVFKPVLCVMDAIVSRTTEGPVGGKSADTKIVLAGKDRVAIDAVGLAILRVVGTESWIADKSVWKQVQIAEAVRIGLGVKGPDEVKLVSEGVAEIADIEAKLRQI